LGHRVIAVVAAAWMLAAVGCGTTTHAAGFWFDDVSFALPAPAAEKLGGLLTEPELDSIKRMPRTELEHAFAIPDSHHRRSSIILARRGKTIIEGIGRGIGRVAAHEFAHQILNVGAVHNDADENSSEYPMSSIGSGHDRRTISEDPSSRRVFVFSDPFRGPFLFGGEDAMSQDVPQDHISKKRAVYRIDGMERATIRKNVVYRTTDAGPLTMDLYYPADVAAGSRLPAVIIVAGYNDVGAEKIFGCKFKEMGMAVSWAQLIAASGLVAIAYTNREPAADLDAVLQHVRDEAPALGLDEDRIGVFAASGNVPLALSALMPQDRGFLKCAALLYGYMLDLDGATGVAEAAQLYRFTNPNAGKSIDDLPQTLPLFIARAGQEQFASLNDSIDGFLAKAVTANCPITFVNHATGPHSFDLLQDSETSREIIRQILSFLRSQLLAEGS
jgi:acetyl esterase/lipase